MGMTSVNTVKLSCVKLIYPQRLEINSFLWFNLGGLKDSVAYVLLEVVEDFIASIDEDVMKKLLRICVSCIKHLHCQILRLYLFHLSF